jgi:4-methyl-5(b-hydroxyethyl)-thiazole monophosphate biosynthesis
LLAAPSLFWETVAMAPEKTEVLVPLADGFEEIEAITIVDLLRRAGLTVTTAHVTPNKGVTGAHGVVVQADRSLKEAAGRTYAAVVLPGGGVGTENLGKSAELGEILKAHREKNAVVAAICAAPSVLAKHGILTGKRATCYPGFEPKLTGAKVENATVVEDGKVITSRGPSTAQPFALKLIERLAGSPKADEIRGQILAG